LYLTEQNAQNCSEDHMKTNQQKARLIGNYTSQWDRHSESAGALITPNGQRKYLDEDERRRFLHSLDTLPEAERALCATLLWTGCRLSEALNLKPENISAVENMVLIRSLKKRESIIYRRVPVPHCYLIEMLKYLSTRRNEDAVFPWKRTQAWQIIKQQMDNINVKGPMASPRGLRHTFGVHAIRSQIPIHLVQKWLGHSRLTTTIIYLDLITDVELEMAKRMWG